MEWEKIGKRLGVFASTAAKKAGEQVQITKLGLDKSGLEKEIDGAYIAIGRYCYTKAKAGDPVSAQLSEYVGDIDALLDRVGAIEGEIDQHKAERDAAAYAPTGDESRFEKPPVGSTVEGDASESKTASDGKESVEQASV